MHHIKTKLPTLAVCLCVLAAAILAPHASAAGNDKDPWYQSYMDEFERNGWLDGIAADGLQPDDSINRAQFASVVNRAAGLTEESAAMDDDDYFGDAQSGVVPAIISAQSPDVSAVSGATYSSKGIMAAVRDALAKAEN